MFVVTKDIETRKFNLAAGQALPPAYQGKYARDSIERVYGKGSLMEVTHRNIGDFKSLIMRIAGTDQEKLTQLSALCETQAQEIESLKKELQGYRSRRQQNAERAAQV